MKYALLTLGALFFAAGPVLAISATQPEHALIALLFCVVGIVLMVGATAIHVFTR